MPAIPKNKSRKEHSCLICRPASSFVQLRYRPSNRNPPVNTVILFPEEFDTRDHKIHWRCKEPLDNRSPINFYDDKFILLGSQIVFDPSPNGHKITHCGSCHFLRINVRFGSPQDPVQGITDVYNFNTIKSYKNYSLSIMPKYTLTKLPKARLSPDPGFCEDQLLASLLYGQQTPNETCGDPAQKNSGHGEGIHCSGYEAGHGQHQSQTLGRDEVTLQAPNTQAQEVLPKETAMTLEPTTGTQLGEDIPKISQQARDPQPSPARKPDARPEISPEILDTDSDKSKMVRFLPPNCPDWPSIDCPFWRRLWI